MTTQPRDTEHEQRDLQIPPLRKLCRACKLPMPFDANKCTECSSLQNWRRYLDSSGIVLSLLVALTSLLTFAIPIWKSTLVAKVAEPSAALVEVDDTGLATFVVANGGNAPAVVEHILFGTKGAAVWFNLEALPPGKRTVKPNGINVFALRLSIENTVDNVWELVKIYRNASGCEAQVVVLAPDGKRKTAVVDASTAGLDKSNDLKDGCPLKLRKLSIMTLTYLGNKSEYSPTLCKVAELHPRDPKNPEIGSACK